MHTSHAQILRTMRRVIGALSVLIALAVPAGYGTIAYKALVTDAEFKARLNAAEVTRMVNANPELWQFEEPRLLTIVGNKFHSPDADRDELRLIVDRDGNTVVSNHGTAAWPTATRSAPLLDSGRVVGYAQITRSVRTLFDGLAVALAIGVLAGLGFFATLRNLPLAALDRALSSLTREKEQAQVTLHAIGDAVITTDHEGKVVFLNPVAEQLSGLTLDQARGNATDTFIRFLDESSGETIPCPVQKALRQKTKVDANHNTLLVRRDGSAVAVDESATPIISEKGVVTGVVLVLHDTSASRELAAKLSYQATHDPLTGLINRREFTSRLERALDTARYENLVHSLAYMDMDQFKIINDTCGHHAGDELLKQFCALVRGVIRASDSFARLGGDEFTLLLEGCPLDIAQRVTNKLMQAVSDFRFQWEGRTYTIGLSIGLTTFDAGSGSPTHILSVADSACYTAKEMGRGRVHVYTPGDSEVDSRRGAMQWASRISQAIDENRLCIHFQTIKSLTHHDPRHKFEILVRMVDLDGNMVPPNAFIPPAERFNLIHKIDRWVIRTTFSVLAEVYGADIGKKVAACSINLSGVTWSDDAIVDFILEQSRLFNIPPEVICFEITETAAINNLARAVSFVERLRRHGFSFALDDFGSGVSSFGYLKQLPVDYLKIDGSFVKSMLEDKIDHAMVEAINQIGHIMGVQTIAEYVENDAIAVKLLELGVDHGQGYGIARPQPIWMLPS